MPGVSSATGEGILRHTEPVHNSPAAPRPAAYRPMRARRACKAVQRDAICIMTTNGRNGAPDTIGGEGDRKSKRSVRPRAGQSGSCLKGGHFGVADALRPCAGRCGGLRLRADLVRHPLVVQSGRVPLGELPRRLTAQLLPEWLAERPNGAASAFSAQVRSKTGVHPRNPPESRPQDRGAGQDMPDHAGCGPQVGAAHGRAHRVKGRLLPGQEGRDRAVRPFPVRGRGPVF